MIETGIPKLDELLEGGIKEGSTLCLWTYPGVVADPFSYQIVSNASKKNMLIYAVNLKNPESVRQEMQQSGFAIKNVEFIDAYSALVKQKSKGKFVVENPKDPASIMKAIESASKQAKGQKLLVFDSLSTLLDLVESKENLLKELKAFFAKSKNTTKIVLFTDWGYEKAFKTKLKALFDAIVEIKAIEEKLFIKRYFSVTKNAWAKKKLAPLAIPFRARPKKGIKIYIPKILITGPFNSGKTSFIHSASTKAVSVDRLGTTIALDHGHCAYKDFEVDLFGTPGQERFDPVLKMLGGEALGVVIVVSATDPAGYERAKEMVEKTGTIGLPYVVVANKADLRGAMPNSAIRNAMGLPAEVPIVRTTAADLKKVQPGLPCELKKGDVEKVLDAIFSRLLKK